MSNSVLKPGWQWVKFGDVVKLSGERRANPAADGLERYVGLEHLEPNDLRIRRWGDTRDGTTFINYFKPGQVLFGKRRAYQRKVAVANFEGVCSGDIYVFEPKDKRLLPELLPFICQTEAFFDYAIGTSAGSLSPRTNWKSLAQYEFALPPLEAQQKLIREFRILGELLDALHAALRISEKLLRRLLMDIFSGLSTRCKKFPIAQLGEVQMGRQKSPKYAKGISPKPFLKVANIGDLELHLDIVEEMDFNERDFARYCLKDGDILITEGDLVSAANVGRPAMYRSEIEGCCFQNTLIRFRANEALDQYFALFLFEAARLIGIFAKAAKTTTVTHLGAGRFSQIELPLPPLEEQVELTQKINLILSVKNQLLRRQEHAFALRQRSLEQLGTSV